MFARFKIHKAYVLHIAILVKNPLSEFNVPFILVLLHSFFFISYFLQNCKKFLSFFIFISLECLGKFFKTDLINIHLFHLQEVALQLKLN